MRPRIGFIAVWIAATTAGTAISWAGVGDALRGTVLAAPDPAVDVPVRQERPPAPAPSPEPLPSTGRPSAPATPSGGPTARRMPPRRTAPSAPDGRIRTYVVKSGRVTLSLSATSARVVSATPGSGFQVRSWRKEKDGWLRVDLTDGTHGSAVFATWNGHPPLVETYEY
ncbi:hypothetical protein [Actinomadura macrotermitis]|nr:hypothetical protein [Actinomadura macrotermitis]